MGLFDLFKRKKNVKGKEVIQASQEKKTYCPKCGAMQMKTTRFCTNCGHELAKKVEEEPAVVYEKNGIKITATEESSNNIFNQPYNQTYAYALFLNKYPVIKGSQYLHENDYPHFMFSNAGVSKVHKLHEELQQKGFYEPTKAGDGLDTFKVGELKEIAVKINVPVKGKKEDIVRILADSGKDFEIEDIIKAKFYKLSDLAKNWLSSNEIEIEYYFSGENCSLEEYKAKRSKYSKEELELQKLNEEIKSDKEQYGRWGYYGLAIYYEEKGDNKEALKNYLMCLRLDCSGCYNNKYLKIVGKSTFLKDNMVDIGCIPPALIKQINNLSDFFSLDLVDAVFIRKLPLDVLDKTTFTDIATMICEGTFDNSSSKEYQKLLEDRLIELIKNR